MAKLSTVKTRAVYTVHFAVAWLISMEDGRATILVSDGTLCLDYGTKRGDSRDVETVLYSNGDSSDFAQVPVDHQIIIRDSHRR